MRARKLVAAAVTAAFVVVGCAIALFLSGGASAAPETRGVQPDVTVERELPELRTRTSRTYLTSTGARLAKVYTGPVNFWDDGAWHAIDNKLEPAGGGAVRNRANRFEVELPETLAEPISATTGDDTVRFRLRGARGTRQVDKASAV